MRAVQVTWLRELRAFKGVFACGVPLCAFLAVAGWSFVRALGLAEGGPLQLQTVWGCAVAPWLPIFCSVLTMRLFAEERATGMLDVLFATSLRERDLAIGKFLAALSVVALALALSVAVPLGILPFFSSTAKAAIHLLPFAAVFAILLLQAAAWCAAGTMISAFFRNPAASAVSSLLLCSAAPVGVYLMMLCWMPEMRAQVPWMPIMIHVYDFSTGFFSLPVVLLYVTATAFFLFGCSKLLVYLRLRG
ncbi:MAG: ABC transporter permease subunit [Kiritimatiellae bacterium]|nr:ABC transporter permease subunit [Kiritimatiellia bacterium]